MTRPFTLDPVQEVPLAGAPLVKVLTQVRFSRAPDLVTDGGEERLAALLPRYPSGGRRRHLRLPLAPPQAR